VKTHFSPAFRQSVTRVSDLHIARSVAAEAPRSRSFPGKILRTSRLQNGHIHQPIQQSTHPPQGHQMNGRLLLLPLLALLLVACDQRSSNDPPTYGVAGTVTSAIGVAVDSDANDPGAPLETNDMVASFRVAASDTEDSPSRVTAPTSIRQPSPAVRRSRCSSVTTIPPIPTPSTWISRSMTRQTSISIPDRWPTPSAPLRERKGSAFPKAATTISSCDPSAAHRTISSPSASPQR